MYQLQDFLTADLTTVIVCVVLYSTDQSYRHSNVQYTVSVVTPLSVRHWSVVIDITSSISRFRTSSVVAIVHARWSAPSNYVVNIQ